LPGKSFIKDKYLF